MGLKPSKNRLASRKPIGRSPPPPKAPPPTIFVLCPNKVNVERDEFCRDDADLRRAASASSAAAARQVAVPGAVPLAAAAAATIVAAAAPTLAPAPVPPPAPLSLPHTTPATAPPLEKTAILVNQRQEGNPLLAFLRNVPWRYERGAGVVGDFTIGNTCIVFVQIKYHLLKAGYTAKRLAGVVAAAGRLRVLLVHRDADVGADAALRDLAVACIAKEWTILVASTLVEAARFIEGFRIFEHKPATAIQGRVETGHTAAAVDVLTTVRFVNKTDAATLLAHFGSVAKVFAANAAALAQPPGMGEKKSRRLAQAFHAPFTRGSGSTVTRGPGPGLDRAPVGGAAKGPNGGDSEEAEEALIVDAESDGESVDSDA